MFVVFLEEPADGEPYVAPHIVGVITRAVGVFLIFFVKEVVGSQQHTQLISIAKWPFDACLKPEEVVCGRRKVDEVARGVKARLL